MMTIISKISNKLPTIFYRILFKVLTKPSGQVGCRNKEIRETWLNKTLTEVLASLFLWAFFIWTLMRFTRACLPELRSNSREMPVLFDMRLTV